MARKFTGGATDAPHVNHTCLIMNYGIPVTNVIMAAYFEFYIRDWIKKHNLDPRPSKLQWPAHQEGCFSPESPIQCFFPFKTNHIYGLCRISPFTHFQSFSVATKAVFTP